MTYSITPASLSQYPDASIAVCAHDAGAASHIAAWLAPFLSQLCPCLAGPADLLFKARFGPVFPDSVTLEQALERAQLLVSGTGWASDLEFHARYLAQQRGIPSVAVLDHWVNYRERFRRDGVEILPDQIWVSDSEALRMSQSSFPDLPVLQLPNLWLEEISTSVQKIRACESRSQSRYPRRPARRLLYLLEPIHEPWSKTQDLHSFSQLEAGEFQGLRYWLSSFPKLIEQGLIAPEQEIETLSLRVHPSEMPIKYKAFIDEFRQRWPIEIDSSHGLADALALADIVFGCETQALIAAMACGLPAYSTIPPWAHPCRLPHSNLNHLSRLCGA